MTTSATPLFVCEQPGIYRAATPEEVRGTALTALTADLTEKPTLSSPNSVKDYLRLQIGDLPHEVFSVMFLDSHNRLLACSHTSKCFAVRSHRRWSHPREVAKRALELGADGVILTHNHPGQTVKPSQADMKLTRTLQEALALIDVNVRDHIIVTRGVASSMAESGLL